MDLAIALWVLFWDVVIVTASVIISWRLAKKGEKAALAMRDEVERKFMSEVNDMREGISNNMHNLDVRIEGMIEGIEIPTVEQITESIPDVDTSAISEQLRTEMAASLNAHVTVIKKQINELGEKIDKAISSTTPSGGYTDPSQDKLFGKILERFL